MPWTALCLLSGWSLAPVVDCSLSGLTRINITGPAGTTVTLIHAEVLQHPPYGPTDGSIYVGNLRSAKATDTFILKGTGAPETFQAHFTYAGSALYIPRGEECVGSGGRGGGGMEPVFPQQEGRSPRE